MKCPKCGGAQFVCETCYNEECHHINSWDGSVQHELACLHSDRSAWRCNCGHEEKNGPDEQEIEMLKAQADADAEAEECDRERGHEERANR